MLPQNAKRFVIARSRNHIYATHRMWRNGVERIQVDKVVGDADTFLLTGLPRSPAPHPTLRVNVVTAPRNDKTHQRFVSSSELCTLNFRHRGADAATG